MEKNNVGRDKLKKITELIRKIKEVNNRKVTIYRIIEEIIRSQEKYLKNGKVEDLTILTETSAAEKIGVDTSSISRAIKERSIETQWGEKPLKFFFPSKKDKIKLILPKIIKKEFSLSDEQIRAKLKEDYNIFCSRRQITACRNELGIPSPFSHREHRGINM